MPDDTLERELRNLRDGMEILQQKNHVLEESVKGALKENTVLHVDLNVLKQQLKELEQASIHHKQTNTSKSTNFELLQSRLDFKIQEADELRKQLEQANQVIFELEKQIQKYEKVKHETEKNNKELDSLKKVVESLQRENENLKS